MTTATRRCNRGERGAGVYGLSAGILMFLLILFFAVQLTFNLYARSHVSSAGFAAARAVAGYRSDDRRAAAAAEAEAVLRERLGSGGGAALVEWDLSRPDVVRLRVAFEVPSIAPERIAGAIGLGEIDRTFEVHVEEPQP